MLALFFCLRFGVDVDQIAMLILLTHVQRKNFGIYGELHLFQNNVTGLTKQLRY